MIKIKTKYLTNEKEIISLLFISRIFTILTFQMGGEEKGSFGSSLLVLGVNFLFFCGFSFFLWVINRKTKSDFLSLISGKNKGIEKLNLVLVALFLLIYLAGTATQFLDFTTTAIYQKTDFIPLCVVFFTMVGYGLYSGFSGLSKSCQAVKWLFCLFFIFIFAITFHTFQMNYLDFSLNADFKNLLPKSFVTLFSAYEFILVLFFLNKVNTSSRLYYRFFIGSFITTIGLSFLVQVTLGGFATSQNYPFYALTMAANLSIFQRLDGLFILLWILISFVKITALGFCVLDTVKKIFGEKTKNLPWILAVVFCFSTIVIKKFNLPDPILLAIYLVGFFYIMIQFIISITKKNRRNEGYEET